MKTPENFVKKLLDACVDLAHKMIDKGYASAWFSWLEWIVLTSAIFVAGRRVGSPILVGIAAVSAVVLFFVGLAGVEKFRDEVLPSQTRVAFSSVFFAAIIDELVKCR